MISQIYIPEKLQDNYSCTEEIGRLKGLNKVNIFVGPNNSGKSRFMRGLFINSFHFHLAEVNFEAIYKATELLTKDVRAAVDEAHVTDISGSAINGVKSTLEQLREKIKNAKLPSDWSILQDVKNYIDRLKIFEYGGSTHLPGTISTGRNWAITANELHKIADKYRGDIETLLPSFLLPNFKKIYIPMLRGLRPIQLVPNRTGFDNDWDSYRARTVKDYFYEFTGTLETDENFDKHTRIFTGLSLYHEVKRKLLGKLPEREKIRKFEEFLSKSFFESKTVSLVPNIDEDCLNITIEAEDRSIYDLGDGIQNIVILLYQVFVHADEEALIFIEEPETSLHPGMQRLFIDTIMDERFQNLQFFITTHSNHFLDMTLDHDRISIFNFTKTGTSNQVKHVIENSENDDIKLLQALGVKNSSVFMSNCTIWVEGITDRLYLNKYLEVYQEKILGETYDTKRLKEDFNFSYVEYGGANITHYSFEDEDHWEQIKASRISNKILLIVDKDNTDENPGSKKAERIARMREHLGDQLILLECREIENSLSPAVIKATVNEIEKATIDLGEFTESDYKNSYLGTFIDTKLVNSRTSFAGNGSGTIQKKVSFCKKAISHIHVVSDLSDYGHKLAKQIYEFINLHNR